MLLEQIKTRRDEITELAAQYGASNLRVFGSVARGEETPDSDIDMIADFAPDRSYLDLVRLKRALQTFLGRQVDLASPPSLIRIQDEIADDITAI